MRLGGGAEDPSSAQSAASNREETGDRALTYRMARSLSLMAVRACGVQAIQTLFVVYRHRDGLAARWRRSRLERFTRITSGRSTQDLPDAADVAQARKAVSALAYAPDGAGQKLDRRHSGLDEAVLTLRGSSAPKDWIAHDHPWLD